MSPLFIILIVLLAVLIVVTIVLYFLGKKAEAKKAEQDAQIEATAQQVSLLVIDKKRMKMKNAGLPDAVLASTPWYAKNSKLPIVKVKAGPKMMNLICDDAIFDSIPVKKEVKARVSGLYIVSVKGLHGKMEVTDSKKKSFRTRLTEKVNTMKAEEDASSGKNKKKK
jgi:hypothetical protein